MSYRPLHLQSALSMLQPGLPPVLPLALLPLLAELVLLLLLLLLLLLSYCFLRSCPILSLLCQLQLLFRSDPFLQ